MDDPPIANKALAELQTFYAASNGKFGLSIDQVNYFERELSDTDVPEHLRKFCADSRAEFEKTVELEDKAQQEFERAVDDVEAERDQANRLAAELEAAKAELEDRFDEQADQLDEERKYNERMELRAAQFALAHRAQWFMFVGLFSLLILLSGTILLGAETLQIALLSTFEKFGLMIFSSFGTLLAVGAINNDDRKQGSTSSSRSKDANRGTGKPVVKQNKEEGEKQ